MTNQQPTNEPAPLLEVRNLTKDFVLKEPGLFGRHQGRVQALNDVSFSLQRGQTLAIVGESGCGKSTLAKSLAMIHRPTSGWIWFDGQSVLTLGAAALKATRRRIQMVFQDPFGSLNPRLTAAEIIGEPLVIHKMGSKESRRHRVAACAESVSINPDDLGRYPHEFSGGQRQRIAIARAIAPAPALVIADEPLSALDVSVQSQILNLMTDLRDQMDLTYIFISHDLAAVRHIADWVAVMYLGRIVEIGRVESIFADSRHPYTQTLLDALPEVGRGKRRRRPIGGDVPSPINPPNGCTFHTRCPKVQEICRNTLPTLSPPAETEDGRLTACYFSDTSSAPG